MNNSPLPPVDENSPKQEPVTSVVIDANMARVIYPLNLFDALALHGTASDDPTSWEDIALLWPRWKWDDANTEFADGLPSSDFVASGHAINQVDGWDGVRRRIADALEDADSWFVIDLPNARIFSGGNFLKFRLRGSAMAIRPDEQGEEVTVLPPWWELHQACEPDEIWHSRETPVERPNPRRDILWGQSLTEFLARSLIREVKQVQRTGESWQGESWEGELMLGYDIAIAVHRDWLMTPREDLQGACPRDFLHQAREWIDDVATSQEFRVRRDEVPVPIPEELSTYGNEPMGSHEMIMYFNACRKTIFAGGAWLIDDPQRADSANVAEQLNGLMWDFLQFWLEAPYEGSHPPGEVIRCQRTRVPLMAGTEYHVIDCDCPICDMAASGLFGPSFCRFDGHHLELDDEFAFSMCKTHEEWESEQAMWASYAESDTSVTEGEQTAVASQIDEKSGGESDDDSVPFESVWQSSYVSDEPIPGDPLGHLKLAFLLAEVVDALKQEGAPQSDVDRLNEAFRDYRSESSGGASQMRDRFVQVLEELGQRYEPILNRCADLQSRVHEFARVPTWGDDLSF